MTHFDFERALDRQKTLQKAYGLDVDDLHGRDRNEAMFGMLVAMEDEIHEVMRTFSWRSWARGTEFSEEHCREELRDVFQFFMNCMLIAGLTPDSLEERLESKTKINYERMNHEYADRIDDEPDRV